MDSDGNSKTKMKEDGTSVSKEKAKQKRGTKRTKTSLPKKESRALVVKKAKKVRPRNFEKEKVSCPQCDRVVRKSSLKDHVNIHHSRKFEYLCEICGDRFLTSYRQRMHKQFKHKINSKYLECKECPYKTLYHSTYKRHVQSHERNSSGNRSTHACSVCGKLFATVGSLKVHVKAHETGKRFGCSWCNKLFLQKGNLKTHMLRHSMELSESMEQAKMQPGEISESVKGKGKFTCDLCDKVFRWQGDLCRHKKVVHFGIKKFACEKCEKRFAHKNQLEEHILWHDNLKPFACAACYKSYRSKYSLKYHFQKAHKELPYVEYHNDDDDSSRFEYIIQ